MINSDTFRLTHTLSLCLAIAVFLGNTSNVMAADMTDNNAYGFALRYGENAVPVLRNEKTEIWTFMANAYLGMQDTISYLTACDTLSTFHSFSPQAALTVDRGTFIRTNDVRVLKKGFETQKARHLYPGLMQAYASLLTFHYSEINVKDSADLYKPYIECISRDSSYLNDMITAKLEYFKAFGPTDSLKAVACEMRGLLQKETALRYCAGISYRFRSEQCDTLSREVGKKDITVMASLLVVIVTASTASVYFVKTRRKHNEAMNEQQGHLRNANKELAVAEMKVLERDRVLANVLNAANAYEERGKGDRIASMIRQLDAGSNDWEKFSLIFNDIDEGFLKRLKEGYPQLTSNDIRLASLIWLGLERKHIARLLAINPDSVKKSIQRLRKRLELPRATDLETFLKSV